MNEPRPLSKSVLPATPHVHPDDRARLSALNVLTATPQDAPAISYYSPELIQCTLPHSDPKCNPWIRKNGNYALIVSSGFDNKGVPYGIPYGSFPRLTLAHIITNVVATQERQIEFSTHFSAFLREIGYTGNHWGSGANGKRIHDQLIRLLSASISFQYESENRNSRLSLNIAPKYDLWFDFKNPNQGSLMGSWIELSEEFFQSILQSPVPLRTDILAALKKSPLAIDVYMWVSYRLFAMQAAGHSELNIHYGLLQAQFGTGIAEGHYRKFRQEFKLALEKVAQYWQPHEGDKERLLLNYDLHETGLTLYRSPLLIGRGKRDQAQNEAQAILTRRTFDQATRREARAIAGSWDVDYLAKQYFTWIEQQGITPANPRAHFFDFIKTHRKRHAEAL